MKWSLVAALVVLAVSSIYITANYPMAAQQPKVSIDKVLMLKDFRTCKADEVPGGDGPPVVRIYPPDDKRNDAYTGFMFQWWINPLTGEVLYRRLGKSNLRIEIK